MPLIKNRQIVPDTWRYVTDADGGLPDGDVIVPLEIWLQHKSTLMARNSGLGLKLEPGQHPADVADDLHRFSVIALNFPTFRDGRAYSYARLLRERFGFKGEIRATGDVARDQVFYMHRCGFDAFEVPEGRDPQGIIAALDDFSVTYQNAADNPLPFFRR
jgi:uncharacterized protein (DUF934 family)